MQQKVTLKLLPAQAADTANLTDFIAAHVGMRKSSITGYNILKRSLDARAKTIWVNITANVFIDEPAQPNAPFSFQFKDVRKSTKHVIIIGAGPAGLFAALQLLEYGIKPIILERGKNVRERRRDLAALNKEGIINPDSNYCFGEGGAGTYSDGKLYTRSNKRGDIDRVLNLFVHFGAEEHIRYQSHPHIGTNKLPHIITAMRQQIVDCGGEILFGKKVTHFNISNNQLATIETADGDIFKADAFILATGHSARDIFLLLQKNNIAIEPKPFALGVRVEHPQVLIDQMQYHCVVRDEFLPPAAYSLVQQVENKGVFSFCMCPGGIIAPAATAAGELVVNGWSPSKRNNPFANSGMVVQVGADDAYNSLKKEGSNIKPDDPLLFMYFQQMVEQKSFAAGGGNFVAPAQRMVDFCDSKTSATLPVNSYGPGLHSVSLNNVLPDFIFRSLAAGFKEFGKKMRAGDNSYFTNEAVVVATESRTSSPVRIPRDAESLAHPQIKNLYPCAEGAGYAGGIVSAAMDGERIAKQLAGLWR